MIDPTPRELKIYIEQLEKRVYERFEKDESAVRLAHNDTLNIWAVIISVSALVAAFVVPFLILHYK